MMYSDEEIAKMMKVFHETEYALSLFLSQASFASKHKKGGAQKALLALEHYMKLPEGIRMELEKEKDNHVSKKKEIEMLCREAVSKEE